jgi:hypothetical protein
VNTYRIKLAAVVAGLAAALITTAAIAGGRGAGVKTQLSGYEEVPLTLSSPASGKFKAQINKRTQQISYKLSYGGFESDVTQAHIHFGARATSGGVSVWLCANNPPITTAPAGTQACPARSGTITGTIAAANVVGPADQGIAPGEFAELVAAIRAGATYVNVHTTANAPGELRGQLASSGKHHGGGDYGKGYGKGYGESPGRGDKGAYEESRDRRDKSAYKESGRRDKRSHDD